MPSIHRPANSPNFAVRFRFQGRNYNRSLGTSDRRKADGLHARISETIWLLEQGRIEVPLGIDPIAFILGDGKVTPKARLLDALGLRDFFALYEERLPSGRKEEETLKGERIHIRHFQKHFGPNRVMQSITKADLQDYVQGRLSNKHRGRPLPISGILSGCPEHTSRAFFSKLRNAT